MANGASTAVGLALLVGSVLLALRGDQKEPPDGFVPPGEGGGSGFQPRAVSEPIVEVEPI